MAGVEMAAKCAEEEFLTEEDYCSKDLTIFPTGILENKHIVRLLIDYNNIDELPEDIGQHLPNLKFFSSIGNNLKGLPESFGKLVNIEEVYLNENSISCLEESFCNLKKLVKLKMTGNLLAALPTNFGELESLELFNCDENLLKKLPKTFGLLEHLRELELAGNKIEILLEGFGMLKELSVLNLSSNKLTVLPETFGNLANLRKVDLSLNKIKFLPSKCSSAHCIEKLYIEKSELSELPPWFDKLECLVELSVQDNELQNCPLSEKFSTVASKLKRLDMRGNYMSDLPNSFGKLSALEYIHFGSVIGELERRNFQNGNWLRTLPDSFCQLSHLRELHIDENRVTELPVNIGDLSSLEFIDLGQNLLHVLPDSFANLQSLRVCYISKNQLQWLPNNIGNLSKLEELKLDDNALVELPESFANLSSLKHLDLFGNKLQEIPEALSSLKNLVSLDIHSNDFKMPVSDIPEIYRKASYPEPDPSLASNWRGRRHKDVSSIKDLIIQQEVTEPIDFEPPPASLNYNENFLLDAIRRNNSVWRCHGENEGRTKRISTGVGGNESGDSQGSDDYDDEEEEEEGSLDDEDDDYEPPILIEVTPWSGLDTSTINKPDPTIFNVQALLEQTECWDEEIDNNIEIYDNVPMTHQHPTRVNYQPVLNGPFTFVPNDIHAPDYVKVPEKYTVIEDQFDNCEDDSTDEVSVDPVF